MKNNKVIKVIISSNKSTLEYYTYKKELKGD